MKMYRTKKNENISKKTTANFRMVSQKVAVWKKVIKYFPTTFK